MEEDDEVDKDDDVLVELDTEEIVDELEVALEVVIDVVLLLVPDKYTAANVPAKPMTIMITTITAEQFWRWHF